MAKRFADTELWQKAWFQDLTIKEKVLVMFLFGNCDCAGVWDINYRLASFIIGETVTEEDIKKINDKKELFIFLSENKIFVKKFIEFQYGNLSDNCKPHKPIIERLKNYGIYERVIKPFGNPLETLEEKEKEKEKEKEQVKEKEKENNTIPFLILKDGEIKTHHLPANDEAVFLRAKSFWERNGAVVLTDKDGEEVGIKDEHYAK